MRKVINKQQRADSKEQAADLKHDSMEFSAASDGEDKLDFDDEEYQEEEISPEELDNLEADTAEEQVYALVAAETDRIADQDNLPEEDWQQDLHSNEEDGNERAHKRTKRK